MVAYDGLKDVQIPRDNDEAPTLLEHTGRGMKAIAYVRVSTDKQAEEGVSLDARDAYAMADAMLKARAA